MKKSQTFDPHVAETVISHGLHIKGSLECENDLWLDGIVEGNIRAEGNITLGVNARVQGNITATNATIGGQVNGDLKVHDKLILGQSAHIFGEVKTASLAVAEGAILIGNISMPNETQIQPQDTTIEETKQ